jgi:hypothetical protein
LFALRTKPGRGLAKFAPRTKPWPSSRCEQNHSNHLAQPVACGLFVEHIACMHAACNAATEGQRSCDADPGPPALAIAPLRKAPLAAAPCSAWPERSPQLSLLGLPYGDLTRASMFTAWPAWGPAHLFMTSPQAQMPVAAPAPQHSMPAILATHYPVQAPQLAPHSRNQGFLASNRLAVTRGPSK